MVNGRVSDRGTTTVFRVVRKRQRCYCSEPKHVHIRVLTESLAKTSTFFALWIRCRVISTHTDQFDLHTPRALGGPISKSLVFRGRTLPARHLPHLVSGPVVEQSSQFPNNFFRTIRCRLSARVAGLSGTAAKTRAQEVRC